MNSPRMCSAVLRWSGTSEKTCTLQSYVVRCCTRSGITKIRSYVVHVVSLLLPEPTNSKDSCCDTWCASFPQRGPTKNSLSRTYVALCSFLGNHRLKQTLKTIHGWRCCRWSRPTKRVFFGFYVFCGTVPGADRLKRMY
jgi:hypothetical protein